jgi:hypothetical protein
MLLDHLNFYVVLFEDHTTSFQCKGDGVSLYRDHGEEFGSSIPHLPKALIWDPLQGAFASMANPIFTYNDASANCALCDRTKNPHPDYSHEPIVTTRVKLHRGDQELCINCYWDIASVAKKSQTTLPDIVSEKLNIRRLMRKKLPATSERQLCEPYDTSDD